MLHSCSCLLNRLVDCLVACLIDRLVDHLVKQTMTAEMTEVQKMDEKVSAEKGTAQSLIDHQMTAKLLLFASHDVRSCSTHLSSLFC